MGEEATSGEGEATSGGEEAASGGEATSGGGEATSGEGDASSEGQHAELHLPSEQYSLCHMASISESRWRKCNDCSTHPVYMLYFSSGACR